MLDELSELRRRREGLKRRHRAEPYPVWFRAEVTRLCAEGLASGFSWKHLAAELGIRRETLERWHARGATPLAPVVLSEPSVAREVAGGALTLVSPDGWEVAGLSLAGVATLLERLR